MARLCTTLLLLVSITACANFEFISACTDTPPPSSEPIRAVFAHYMLYADLDLGVMKNEIQLAQSKGIDAFALNSNVWRPNLVNRMYQAAQELGTNFKIFFSADIHKDGNGNLSPDILVTMLNYKSHPNQMRYKGKSLFTSWLGNDDAWWSEFGKTAMDGWNDVFQRAGGKDQFHFIPFFPTDGSEYGVKGMLDQWSATIDGLQSWDLSAWNPSDVANKWYTRGCNSRGKTFLATVSPWFFKTQPFDSCQVKTDYQGPGLWLSKWKEMVDQSVPLVEIATWNDWPESSYVGPQFTPQGAALDVTAFPHQAFLELGAYYIQWWKAGTELPPAITSNKMFMFYYTNSKNAGGSCAMKEVLTEKLYVTTMLTQPGSLVLTSGSATQSFSAGAGITTFSIAAHGGEQKATFNGVATLVGQQQIKFDIDVGAANFNVYSTYLSF